MILVCDALFHVLVHHIEETVATFTALLFYIYSYELISGPVSLLTFQTKNFPATDNAMAARLYLHVNLS